MKVATLTHNIDIQREHLGQWAFAKSQLAINNARILVLEATKNYAESRTDGELERNRLRLNTVMEQNEKFLKPKTSLLGKVFGSSNTNYDNKVDHYIIAACELRKDRYVNNRIEPKPKLEQKAERIVTPPPKFK